jgi:hypothetical protein
MSTYRSGFFVREHSILCLSSKWMVITSYPYYAEFERILRLINGATANPADLLKSIYNPAFILEQGKKSAFIDYLKMHVLTEEKWLDHAILFKDLSAFKMLPKCTTMR